LGFSSGATADGPGATPLGVGREQPRLRLKPVELAGDVQGALHAVPIDFQPGHGAAAKPREAQLRGMHAGHQLLDLMIDPLPLQHQANRL